MDVQGGLHVDLGVLERDTVGELRWGGGEWEWLPKAAPTLSAASPHFSMAARPWLWMWVSRSFFSSPRPSVIRDTRLYIRPRSEEGRRCGGLTTV